MTQQNENLKTEDGGSRPVDALVMRRSGLFDITGKEIRVGDRLRFLPCKATKAANDGCIWDGTVTFEDGMFTISTLDAEQVKNPKKWDQKHDWIKSRWWGSTVGYGEFGSWNCPRRPLTEIQNGFGSRQEDFEKIYKPLAEKVGWGKRILNVKIIK